VKLGNKQQNTENKLPSFDEHYFYINYQLFKHNGNTNLTSEQVQKENTLYTKKWS